MTHPQVQSPNEPTSDFSIDEEEKIHNTKVQITQSLNNTIEVGEKTRDIGKATSSKLRAERSRSLEVINEDLHAISKEQSQATYNLKTGFSWIGAFKRKFHRKSSKEKLESKNKTQPLMTRHAHQPCDNDRGLSAEKKKRGNVDLKSNFSENMATRYVDQLDEIESIVDDLARQGKEMTEELKLQNAALGSIDHKLADFFQTSKKQNVIVKKRFR